MKRGAPESSSNEQRPTKRRGTVTVRGPLGFADHIAKLEQAWHGAILHTVRVPASLTGIIVSYAPCHVVYSNKFLTLVKEDEYDPCFSEINYCVGIGVGDALYFGGFCQPPILVRVQSIEPPKLLLIERPPLYYDETDREVFLQLEDVPDVVYRGILGHWCYHFDHLVTSNRKKANRWKKDQDLWFVEKEEDDDRWVFSYHSTAVFIWQEWLDFYRLPSYDGAPRPTSFDQLLTMMATVDPHWIAEMARRVKDYRDGSRDSHMPNFDYTSPREPTLSNLIYRTQFAPNRWVGGDD